MSFETKKLLKCALCNGEVALYTIHTYNGVDGDILDEKVKCVVDLCSNCSSDDSKKYNTNDNDGLLNDVTYVVNCKYCDGWVNIKVTKNDECMVIPCEKCHVGKWGEAK